ncbi:beta-ketoacyl-ACP synthase [Bauldia litoralis]|uniref:3-oxoacyl-[acyl-carrier-protein] synthase II n=2 Tax=Bauldia litoralis TaxID=665467 RepID=A0A1G6EH66_9HYPH|nr:beta-ketoacyl-ACP synthase [Bauldia litoralis]SDB56783.1 3-oxoacyl-[acyl-carrier-protein] synthase II [Bauldia litoralis]
MALRDKRDRPVVAVTGMGVVSSLGTGLEDNWTALVAGRSGIKEITRFPTTHLRTTFAGTVDFPEVDPRDLKLTIGELAIDEAVRMSGIGKPGDFPGPLFTAIPPVELGWPARRRLYEAVGPEAGEDAYDRMCRAAGQANDREEFERSMYGYVSEKLADRFGTKGAPISLTTACASGATAIQLGVEAIRRGETEAALCVGTDCSVTAEEIVRFSLLSALSSYKGPPEEAAKPFSKNRDGFVIAEGSAALVLEDYDVAKARGARILAVIRGAADKNDDFHRTRSKPDGSAVIGALRATFEDAAMHPDEINYINAHGTGTPENDRMEAFSLDKVFGERLRNVPISSNKSMLGHTLTSSGALEAVISIKTMHAGVIPPTINYKVPDPDITLDVVPNVAREGNVSVVLSNSFGFGGQNACLIIAAEPA